MSYLERSDGVRRRRATSCCATTSAIRSPTSRCSRIFAEALPDGVSTREIP